MAYALPDLAVTGQVIAAAWGNQNRSNWAESCPGVVTAAGDMTYADGAGSMTRLAKGTAYQQLVMNSGASAPQWITQPACRVKRSSLNVLTGTPTYVEWDGEVFDAGGMHDNVTNNTRLTAPIAGIYFVSALMIAEYGTNHNWYTRIIKNRTSTELVERLIFSADTPVAVTLRVNGLVNLAAGDYVEVQVEQDDGTTRAIVSSGDMPTFSAHRVAYV